jgi:hypothetical protein
VFKTRIKRVDFLFNVIVLALFAIVASTQILSAYGAICTVWDFPRVSPVTGTMDGPGAGYFGNDVTRAWAFIYQPSNVITWIVAFAYGALMYLYLTKIRWNYFFLIAMVVAVTGFITGFLPAMLSDTDGFTIPFEGIGSPNWGRTIGNAIMMIVLLLMQFVPRLKVAAKSFVEERNIAGQYVKQMILISLFFFWMAATSFLGTQFMRDAHVIDGVNVWQLVDFQFAGGVITAVIGSSIMSTALIYNQIRPSSALITTK